MSPLARAYRQPLLGNKGGLYFRSNADAQVHFNCTDADWRKGNVVSPMVIAALNNGISSGRIYINGARIEGYSAAASSQPAVSELPNSCEATALGAAPLGYFHGKLYEFLYYDGYPNTTQRSRRSPIT